MNNLLAMALLVSIFPLQVQLHSPDTCMHDIVSKFKTLAVQDPNSIDNVDVEMQSVINSQLTKSYEYHLLAIHAKSYHKNRSGFKKLYQALSNRAYYNAIDFIKQITARGGKIDFNSEKKRPAAVPPLNINLEMDELHSLSLALDNEKLLMERAMHAQMKQTFLDDQSMLVRMLSGYVQDLLKLMSGGNPVAALHWFDKHLQDQDALELDDMEL